MAPLDSLSKDPSFSPLSPSPSWLHWKAATGTSERDACECERGRELGYSHLDSLGFSVSLLFRLYFCLLGLTTALPFLRQAPEPTAVLVCFFGHVSQRHEFESANLQDRPVTTERLVGNTDSAWTFIVSKSVFPQPRFLHGSMSGQLWRLCCSVSGSHLSSISVVSRDFLLQWRASSDRPCPERLSWRRISGHSSPRCPLPR